MTYFKERYPERITQLEEELIPIANEANAAIKAGYEEVAMDKCKQIVNVVNNFLDTTKQHLTYYQDQLKLDDIEKLSPEYIKAQFKDPSVQAFFNFLYIEKINK